MNKLDASQREGVARMVEAEAEGHGLVIADQMGFGKTHQMCGLMASSPIDYPTLIVCVPASMTFWRDTIRWMTGTPPYVMIAGCTASVLADPGDVVLVPHSFFKTSVAKSFSTSMHVEELIGIQWGRVVVDEAHKLLREGTMSRALLDRVSALYR